MDRNLYYFISYCREDKKFVFRFVKKLRDVQINVWLDQSNIQPGIPWDNSVQEALKKCYGVIVILSPRSVQSKNVLDEIGYAANADKRLIPVVYEKCTPPLLLTRLHRIDLSEDRDKGLQELLKCLREGEPLVQTAATDLDTSKIVFSVEDALEFLSIAPRGLIKKIISAVPDSKWFDRFTVLNMLKGLPLGKIFLFDVAWIAILAIVIGLIFPPIMPRPWLIFMTASLALSMAIFVFYQKWLRRVNTQLVRPILTRQLPRRSPTKIDGQRAKSLWVRVSPILWELVGMPFDDWQGYLDETCTDQELRLQVDSFLSIPIIATMSIKKS